jgi:hypothetical protein
MKQHSCRSDLGSNNRHVDKGAKGRLLGFGRGALPERHPGLRKVKP